MKACKKRKKEKYGRGQVVYVTEFLHNGFYKIEESEFGWDDGWWYWFTNESVGAIPERKLRALTKTEKEGRR